MSFTRLKWRWWAPERLGKILPSGPVTLLWQETQVPGLGMLLERSPPIGRLVWHLPQAGATFPPRSGSANVTGVAQPFRPVHAVLLALLAALVAAVLLPGRERREDRGDVRAVRYVSRPVVQQTD